MYNKQYLSKRPFLIVTNHYVPAPGARTQQKDWTEKSGWQTKEEVQVVDAVKDKHLSTATVIIDVMEAKLIKNGFSSNSSSDEIVHHFMTKYKDQVSESINIWMERLARKKALEQLDDEVEFTEVANEVLGETKVSATGD